MIKSQGWLGCGSVRGVLSLSIQGPRFYSPAPHKTEITMHACNPSTRELGAEGPGGQGHSRLRDFEMLCAKAWYKLHLGCPSSWNPAPALGSDYIMRALPSQKDYSTDRFEF